MERYVGRRPSSRTAHGGRPQLPRGLVEALLEPTGPGGPAVFDADGCTTRSELAGLAGRIAGGLRERGVRGGDRVVVMLPDGRTQVASLLGAMRAGAVAVPLDPALPPERLAAVLDDCEPSLVVAERPVADLSPVASPGILARSAQVAAARGAGDDVALMIYTSGTTGRPKAVTHRHDCADGASFLRDGLGVGFGDRCLAVAASHTALGLFIGLLRPLACGAAAIRVPRRATVRSMLEAVERNGVTVLAAVPTFWVQLMAFLDRHPDQVARLATVRHAISSGDRLPSATAAGVQDALDVELIDGLGSAECGDIVLASHGAPLSHGTGRPTPGIDLRPIDDTGRVAPPGKPGRLSVRSRGASPGYWHRPWETAELRRGDWLVSGDVVVEEAGGYRHLGRADDLYKVDGSWVSPADVEALIDQHPAVARAAAVGVPDARGLVRTAAFVVLRAGVDAGPHLAAELVRRVARGLCAAQAPATVSVLADLPCTPAGKVDRRRLLDLAQRTGWAHQRSDLLGSAV